MNDDYEMILAGIVGSHAYGLNHAESDIDMLGVFQRPTTVVLGLNPGKDSIGGHDPDWQAHELAKFMGLAMKGNPTVTEMLWLPDEMYALRTPTGDRLIENRELFLSKNIFYAFGGYAKEQFRRLKATGHFDPDKNGDKKTEKHARHLARLIIQGTGVLTTGQLTVRLTPDQVAYARQVGIDAAKENFDEIDALLDAYELLKEDNVLPEKADQHAISDLLVELRLAAI